MNGQANSTPHYLDLDGVDDYLAVPDSDTLSFGNGGSDSPLTFEAWFRPDSLANRQNLLSKWAGPDQEYKLHIAGGVLRLDLYDPSTQSTVSTYTGSIGSLIGAWHHVAVTYDGRGGASAANGVTFYVDGAIVPVTRINSASYVAMENGTRLLQIGHEGTNFRQYDGGLDELRIWSVARTQSDIQMHMSSELGNAAEAGLRAYWRFNEGIGTTAADASPGGHTATLYNAPAWAAGGPIGGADPDMDPPQITDVATTDVTASSATIGFATNEITTGWVSLTSTGSCPCTEVYSKNVGVTHRIDLAGLLPDTLYTYQANARDAAGNVQVSPPATFTTLVAPADSTPPSVTITSPAPGSVSNLVQLQATATDDVGVAGVQFKVDGANLGPEDVVAPYVMAWDTTATANGSHTITAEARDTANNVSVTSVVVDVSNQPSTSSPFYLDFDGLDDYLAAADSDALSFGNGTADTPFTLEAWVRIDTMASRQTLVGKWGGANQEYKLHISGSTLRLDLYDASTQATVSAYTSDQSALIGSWHHVAVTYDGRGGTTAANGITFYVDGATAPVTRLNSTNYVAMENGTRLLQIGHEGTNFRQYDGGLDELRLWSTVRAQSDIQAHMSTELSNAAEPGLVAYWKFNEGSGPTAADASPGGHAATLFNGPTWVAGGPLTPPGTEAPAITSAASGQFTVGSFGAFIVNSTGSPLPALAVSGALPNGVTFADNGDGTATLSGTPAASTGGVYVLTLTAANGVGSAATQTFTLTVRQTPAITSPSAASFPAGSASSVTIATSGFPAPTLAVSGALPAGVTFVDNGNGTATLTGTPAPGSGRAYALTISATNDVGVANQSFTLTVTQPPAITSGTTIAFSIGSPSSFTVTTTGYPIPAIAASGTLPGGVTFVDNGNATATLAGTPTAAGTYPLTITATNGIGTSATQTLILTVQACAVSPPAGALGPATFGVAYAFTFTATGGTGNTFAVTAGTLPSGLTLASGGALTGVPAVTGTSSFTVTATNTVGCSASNAYSLTVTPDAQNESFANGVGNTEYRVGIGAGATPAIVVSGTVLSNDHGVGTLQAGPASIVSTHGGQVAMAASGAFVYTPPVGFAGPSDTFTYTLTDGNGVSDTATVTMNLTGVVWYVNAAAGAGDGRSHNPFNTMTAASNAALQGQYVYVHQGAPAGATTLKAGQTLWGAGSTFVVNGLIIPATTPPTLQGTLTLADSVVVSSLAVNGGSAPAIVANGLIGTEALNAVSITGGSTGLQLSNLGGNFTMSGGTISGVSGGSAVMMSSGTGNVTIGASVVNTGGRSIEVRNRTAGTVTFSGAITDSGAGVLLDANTGSSIAFTGGLALSTGGNAAFTATGGGTLTVTQDNGTIVNTIATIAGTALTVANTDIGAAGLTFRSISAGTSYLTPGVGIVLDNTGTSPQHGGLTVTGNGTAQSGGIIRRKTGPDGATTAGVGIYLNRTKDPSFNWMDLNRFDNTAILGRNVSGFTLTNSVINTAGNLAGSAEGPVIFGTDVLEGLQGSGIIRNTLIQGGVEDNVAVYSHSGTMSLLIESATSTADDCLIGYNSTTTGGRGLRVQTDGTATAVVTVKGCRVRNNRTTGVFGAAAGDSNLTLIVTGSATDGQLKTQINRQTSGGQGEDGIVVSNSGNARATVTIENSIISGFVGAGVRVGQTPGDASAISMLRATITANAITSPAGSTGSAIVGRFSSSPGEVSQSRILIADNMTPQAAGINQYGTLSAVQILTPDSGTTPAVDVTITGNHVDMRESSPGSGIRGDVGLSLRAMYGFVCANVQNNISHLYPVDTDPQGGGIRLEQVGGGVLNLERGSQSLGTTAADVLSANNPPPGSTTMIREVLGSVTVVENQTCASPSSR